MENKKYKHILLQYNILQQDIKYKTQRVPSIKTREIRLGSKTVFHFFDVKKERKKWTKQKQFQQQPRCPKHGHPLQYYYLLFLDNKDNTESLSVHY